MPKKAPLSGFYFYMKDLQEQLRENGNTPSMKQMPEIAHPLYQALPREKKLFYENKAKAAKNIRKETDEGRLTSDGVPVAQIQAEELLKEQENERVISKVRSFVHENIANIEDTPIYIASFNVLVATREGRYYPNEIGLVEYTLRDGIKDSYHCFVDPGKIPQGYSSDAKQHSEKYHQIPFIMYDFTLAKNDYTEIFHDFIKFVKAYKGKQVIFCHEEQVEQTQACYDWLSNATKEDQYWNNIVIADLGILLDELYDVKGFGRLPSVAISDMLVSSTYDYSLNTRCDYHEDLDSCYCALGFSRKMCFIISDNFCPIFNLELTASHLPERFQNIEKFEDEGIQNVNPPNFSQLSLMNGEEARNFVAANFSDEEDDSDQGFFQVASKPKASQKHSVETVSTVTLSSKPLKVLYSDLEFPQINCGGIGRGRALNKKK